MLATRSCSCHLPADSFSPCRSPSTLSPAKQTFPAEGVSIPCKAPQVFSPSRPAPFSISPFLLQPLPADSQLLHFPPSSDHLFIFMYYPRLAITFFPLLSISTPLSSAQPLNVVSHLPGLPSLCLVEALNHTSVSSPLSLSLSRSSSAGRLYEQGSLMLSCRNTLWHTVCTVQALLHP